MEFNTFDLILLVLITSLLLFGVVEILEYFNIEL